MALSYALQHPDEVAGVIAFSGYVPQTVVDSLVTPAGRPGPRFFLTQGRRDPLFPFSRLEETATLLASLGYRSTVVAHDGGHDIPLAAVEAAELWLSESLATGAADP